jgi:hypothetical protein
VRSRGDVSFRDARAVTHGAITVETTHENDGTTSTARVRRSVSLGRRRARV